MVQTWLNCRVSHFNSQPPEGGWPSHCSSSALSAIISTHSRPKAAGGLPCPVIGAGMPIISTHSRPKAAGRFLRAFRFPIPFQLTAARRRLVIGINGRLRFRLFQLTAARRRLVSSGLRTTPPLAFQLTAARRRLVGQAGGFSPSELHFNSQPPEGGWRRRVPAAS